MGAAPAPTRDGAAPGSGRVELVSGGMTCASCAARIERRLDVPGVRPRRRRPAARGPGLLNPVIAGAATAFSSVFVVGDSLRLRRSRPDAA